MALNYSHETQQDIHLFTMTGRITSETDIDNLMKETENLSKIVFNISALEHANSTGINFMIRTLTRCRVNGGDLVLTGLGGNVKKLFELAKIDGLFTVKESAGEAINYFKQ